MKTHKQTQLFSVRYVRLFPSFGELTFINVGAKLSVVDLLIVFMVVLIVKDAELLGSKSTLAHQLVQDTTELLTRYIATSKAVVVDEELGEANTSRLHVDTNFVFDIKSVTLASTYTLKPNHSN